MDFGGSPAAIHLEKADWTLYNMKNNSNLIIAVIAVVGFIFLWDKLVVSRFTPPKQTASQASPTSQPILPPSDSLNLTTPVSAQKVIQPSTNHLKTETADVTIESWGGKISSWKVKERDHWVELVTRKKSPKTLPLETFGQINFGVESLTADKIVLAAHHPQGFLIRKTLVLNTPDVPGSVTLQFKNVSKEPVAIDTVLGWGEGLDKHSLNEANQKKPQAVDAHFAEMRAVAYSNDRLMSWKAGFIFGRTVEQTVSGSFDWIGVDNNHFVAAFVADQEPISEVNVFTTRDVAPVIDIPVKFQLAPGEEKTTSYLFYVGPKDFKSLKAAGHHLEKSVSFGIFGFISKGLLRALEFFKKTTGNYGWSIIIVTILLQIAVFPLTKKSLSHALRMRELQPQMKQLQAQFKSDPKRLQIETLNLYKRHGMNFMGLEGCFPVLLQIPVFFAFYSALNGAYELRGAPWIFWIKDLAAPDAFYVLPVIMGAGMYFQQKLTTVPTDPSQATMMKLMPIIFVFMFLKMPAGLVLYWSVNSACTILGQRLLKWQKESQARSSP